MRLLCLVASFVTLLSSAAVGTEYDPADDNRAHQDLVTYRFFLASPDDPEVQAAIQRDLQFADEMMEHHRGAVRMSRAYLDDERGRNPFLERMADAIIQNQRFEIEWLEDLRSRVAKGPQPVMGIDGSQLVRVEQGVSGMEHRIGFLKTPIWAASDFVNTGGDLVKLLERKAKKGVVIYLEGKLRTREYEKGGQKHRATDIIADTDGVVRFSDRVSAEADAAE